MEFIRLYFRNPGAVIGLVLLALVLVMAGSADFLYPRDPLSLAGRPLQWPFATDRFLLGTDASGRDIAAQIFHGARISLLIGFVSTLVAIALGIVVGAVAGYYGGWVDKALMGVTDVFLSLPRLILALAFVAALGPGIENAVIAIAITAWPVYSRIARAETLTFRNSEFIAAVRMQGASGLRVIGLHVIPLCLSSTIVRVTLDMAGIILTAAGLGFLGLGAQPPLPEWGAMISKGRAFILDQWWVATMPGFAIVVVSLGFCLFGDGLRDVLDPKQRTKG